MNTSRLGLARLGLSWLGLGFEPESTALDPAISQVMLEVLTPTVSPFVSQIMLEVLIPNSTPPKVSQVMLEVLTVNIATPFSIEEPEMKTFSVTCDADGNPNSSAAMDGGGLLVSRVVTLSSAQLLALGTTPVELIPTPGPGKIIMPTMITMTMQAGSTPYTGDSDGETFTINTFDVAIGAVGFVDKASNFTGNVSLAGFADFDSVLANQPLLISTPDMLTLGNGTLRVKITYVVVSV